MQISLKWLNDYIDLEDFQSDPQKLADLLTNTGLEVEEITDLSSAFKYLVIGHILKKEMHPDADKLSLCQVETNAGSVQQIVCGAKNHKEGDKVVVALPGAVLPGDFAIKQSSIRGVESSGMLCSEKELGLSEEADGIMILPQDAPVGEAYSNYASLDDVLFELKVTPNRADCLSHFGLARELSCLLGRELKLPSLDLKVDETDDTQKEMGLEVLEADLCPRYTGRFISGVKIQNSPAWLKARVEAIGLNSINNVVDITNYVMMEMGQPLHAFDTRFIEGSKIQVSKAKAGEKFTSLDDSEFSLDGSELVIRDTKNIIAMAGVVGGKNSGVVDDTTDIFIECAYFVPQTVRKTARKLGIETDSAYRFSRGTDPSNLEFVLDRACSLINQFAGGTSYGNHHDFYPAPVAAAKFSVDSPYISSRTGYDVSHDELKALLVQLKFEHKDSGSSFEVTAPSFRVDLFSKEDLVEEYARVFSYEKIPEKMPRLDLEPSPHSKEYVLQKTIRGFLTEESYLEALNYNFVNNDFQKDFLGNSEKLSKFGISTSEKPIRVLNPLNEDFGVMRNTLVPGLVKNVMHNSRRGKAVGRLFEIGYAFGRDSEFGQDQRLAFCSWGSEDGLWENANKSVPLVLELKASVEALLKRLRAKSWDWRSEGEVPDFLHPGRSAALFFEGRILGFVGELHPELRKNMKIKENVCVAEFQLDALLRGQPKGFRISSISKMPQIERDLAFVCDKNLQAGEISSLIKKLSGKILKDIEVFDQFEGGTLEASKKSVAFRMHFQAQNDTLSDDQINSLQTKILEQVASKLGAEVR